MSEDYKQGFVDGFELGYRYGKAYNEILSEVSMTCKVCGRSGMTAVVCNVPQCPTRVTSSSYGHFTGPIGAAGSSMQSNLPTGSNGATGV